MKTIGTTPSGGILIELNQEEAKVLSMAESAMKNKVQWEIFAGRGDRPSDETPFAEIFKALQNWLRLKLSLNELQRGIDTCKSALGEQP